METKMEELKTTPRPLNLNDGWEQQVNGKAKRNQAIKRANRIMCLFYIGFGLLAACGIYLGYTEEVPIGISVTVTMVYVALLSYTVGFLIGRKKRR